MPLGQLRIQFPKSKYNEFMQFKQLLLRSVGLSAQVKQFSWHLSIVLSSELLQ